MEATAATNIFSEDQFHLPFIQMMVLGKVVLLK
mgnify:CR=1 FL=1